MDAGDLDDEVTILTRSEGTDELYGSPVSTWVAGETVWAQVKDVLPSRAGLATDEIDISRRPCRIRMRWRNDISTANRFRFDGRDLQIISGPAEIGRRKWVEFMAEDLSTEGDGS